MPDIDGTRMLLVASGSASGAHVCLLSMPVTVLDTHAAVWWMSDHAKLSPKAKRAIQASISAGDLVMSAASVLEIATLVRRRRLELTRELGEWPDRDVRLVTSGTITRPTLVTT